MRVDVAFTPQEARGQAVGIVVDVLRAGSTIVQALDSGYLRVLCCAEVEEAVAIRAELSEGVLAGERGAAPIPGFDLGNSPREVVDPLAETLVLTTTNGTRAILAAVRQCETVYVGSLLNLDAIAAAANAGGGDVEVVCAGVDGERAPDDVYCAGRIVELLHGNRSEAAEEAVSVARSFASAVEALSASGNPRQAGLEGDIEWSARESVCAVVPVVTGMRGAAAEVMPA